LVSIAFEKIDVEIVVNQTPDTESGIDGGRKEKAKRGDSEKPRENGA
jgi:hypothetical protein